MGMRKTLAYGVGLFFAMGAVLLGPSVFACNTSEIGGHYYGGPLWAPSYGNSGALTQVHVSSGSCSGCGQGGQPWGVHQELWEGTADTSWSSSSRAWVEIGYSYGWNGGSELTWFWADQRPGYSFADHQITAVTPVVGDYYNLKIWDDSSNDTWYGAIDGTTYAASTPNGSGSEWMQAGLESYNADQTLKYTVANQLQYRQGTTWYSSWYAQAMYCSTPAAAGWLG